MTKNKLFAFIKLMVIRKKSKFAYSTHTQQLTALFLAIFDLFCLTSCKRLRVYTLPFIVKVLTFAP